MPAWLPRTLARLRALVAARRVCFTEKAKAELGALQLTTDDAVEILAMLGARDAPSRVRSHRTDEWLYEFRPDVAGLGLYVKIALRHDCVVVSCHEDEAEKNRGADGIG